MPDAGLARTVRLRSQAQWAYTLAGILGLAALAGLAQLVFSGAVSLPGREPLSGPAAHESLIALFLASAALAAIGALLRRRAGRHGPA